MTGERKYFEVTDYGNPEVGAFSVIKPRRVGGLDIEVGPVLEELRDLTDGLIIRDGATNIVIDMRKVSRVSGDAWTSLKIVGVMLLSFGGKLTLVGLNETDRKDFETDGTERISYESDLGRWIRERD